MGIAFAIAKAAARSDYELRRTSVCVPYDSPTLSIVTYMDTAVDMMIKVADKLIETHNIWPYFQTDALTLTRDIYISLSHSSNDMVKKHHCPRKGKGKQLPHGRIILQDPERPNKLGILREDADDSILQFYNLCQISIMDLRNIWIRSIVRDGKSIRDCPK
jgi:hypothetical protein